MADRSHIRNLFPVPFALKSWIWRAGLWIIAGVFALSLSFIDHQAFAGTANLSWVAPTTYTDGTPLTNLAGYKVYYGTSPGNYGAPVNVGNQTNYTATGLGGGSYYFAVTAYDTSGSESGFSNEGSKTITAVPPVISAIAASNVTATGATITWTTDVASSSQVEYGTTTAYGTTTTLNSLLVTSHSQALSGLQAATLYHYRVWSIDAVNNVAISGDNTFTTLAAADTTPPALSGIAAGNLTSSSATITWATNEASTTQVEYGLTTSYGSATAVNNTLVTSHSQSLSGLASSTTYHYRVKSADGSNNLATSGDFTFITTAAPDTTPPVISGVTASNLTSSSATITWATNEASTTQVEYGLTTSYGSATAVNNTLVTSHSQGLSGLTASTTYHYRAKSADASNNLAMSGDVTFTTTSVADTTPPGDPQSFTAVSGNQQIMLSWVNPPDPDFVGVRVRYRTDRFPVGINDGTLLGDFAGQTNAQMTTTQTGLLNGVTYYYSASSYDFSGNYQSTAHASATPLPDSNSGGQSSAGGGCGMIMPKGGNTINPKQRADLLALLVVSLSFLLRKKVRSLTMALTTALPVCHARSVTAAFRATVHLRKKFLGVQQGELLAQHFHAHHANDGCTRLLRVWQWRRWRNHQRWFWWRNWRGDAQLDSANDQCGWNAFNRSCWV
jgi:hypothetical protein